MSVATFDCIPGITITRVRKAASEYDTAGDWVAGAPTSDPVEGVVHPATSGNRSLSDQMIREIDNNRNRKMVVVYSVPATWQPEDEEAGQQADIMIYNGDRYEIMMIDDWDSGVLDHQKALAARLDLRDGD